MYTAQTVMVHDFLHKSEYGTGNLALWGFVVKHAIWLHNHISNYLSGLTPLECSPRTRPFTVTYSAFMFGVAQSMSLIQSYRMDRRFPSGIFHHAWANSWVLAIQILLLWPMSATSLLVICHHNIT